jgi:hypothetical protein
MTIKGISLPRKLTIIGFALPYLVIIFIAVIITLAPGTTDEKWSKAGGIAFMLPFIAGLIGAFFVGIGSVEKEKIETKRKSLLHAFIFGFLWAAVFHFFITLYFFMLIVYMFAGMEL